MAHLRLLGLAVAALSLGGARVTETRQAAACDTTIELPAGFCAVVFAESLHAPRHMHVMPNGDVYVSLSGRGGRGGTPSTGGVIMLRDANKDGRADSQADVARGFSASEVTVFDNHLYTENGTAVFRFPIRPGQAAPTGAADTVVSGLPPATGHGRKTVAIGRDGSLYVNIGSATNVCAGRSDDQKRPPDPCPEIQTRAGIWRFDARKSGQKQSDGVHFAIGFRNGVGLTIGPDDRLWGVQHGRDGLHQNWPDLFDARYGAENPAEELVQVNRGDDLGWPYCYFSNAEKRKVDAPEYGGDGRKTTRCAGKKAPAAVFPGHWAPNDVVFYTGTMFPARYRNGAFIAFHGSWNRAPEPQAGFRVVFQPIQGDRATGDHETFANGFAPKLNADRANDRRPTGVAVGPDGALYISDDQTGRIWKVIYTGR